MDQRSTVARPRLEARIAGFLYLLVIILGAFAEIGVRQGLVTDGDPAATARAIMTHQDLFRLGFAAEMITNIIAIPTTLIIYRLLAPAGQFLALLGMAFDLTQNTINSVNAWTQFAPLTLLGDSPDLAAVPHAELVALERLALKWHDLGFQIALTFFGFALLIEGYLIFRSGYFPRWLGALYALAGRLLSDQQLRLFPGPAHLSIHSLPLRDRRGALCLWLLVVGRATSVISEPIVARSSIAEKRQPRQKPARMPFSCRGSC
jgi:hypothetical protein